MAPKLIDLTGIKFGRLTVMKRVERKTTNTRWFCECECGTIKEVYGMFLKNGDTVSCGCFRREHSSTNNATHRLTKTTEYRIWRGMIGRCKYEYVNGYKNYGGRGIKVCDRWGNFELFLLDMGSRPSLNHTLDRIDVNGNYEPSNCKWSTIAEQGRNKRISKHNKSGHVGVHFAKNHNAYQVAVSGKHIGTFRNLEDAVKARKDAEMKYWVKESS